MTRLRIRSTALVVLAAMASITAVSVTAGAAPPSIVQHTATAKRIVGTAPRPVSSNEIHRHATRDANAVLSLNLGLDVRNSAELDDVISAASAPGSPDYGNYLTEAEYRSRYAPTDAAVQSVRSWVIAQGMRVTGVSADNALVSVEATTAVAERVFGVTIGEYNDAGRTFYANDVAPSVPAVSPVRWVTGLDNFTTYRAFAFEPNAINGAYEPSDFQTGYNTGGATTTRGVGFTLWGAPMVQGDLNAFASATGSTAVVIDGAGADGINFIPCTTADCLGATQSTDTDAWLETALDVESAHGIGPGGHMKYWLASTDGNGHPSGTALENALSAAANDSTLDIVSNSWGADVDGYDQNMDVSFQHGASVGKTFYFSSGDNATVSYPATSPYVVSVGGTSLTLNGSGGYVSETTWSGSGTGCSAHFPRPSWQVGVTSATCTGRAEPDVAADANPFTGAYVYVGGSPFKVGGTSLAAPLWAGMTAVWNQANVNAAKPLVGFAAPLFYALGNNPSVYHSVFHDVTTGSAGGNDAGTGWDQVTGWGSPNLANMIAAYQGLAASSTTLAASKNPTTVGATVVYTATVSPVPIGGTVTFRRNGKAIGGCTSKGVSSAGHAACSIEHGDAATLKIQAAYSGNAALFASASNIVLEKVNPAPQSAGYWMAGRGGAVYGFGSSVFYGSASTANVTHFEPTPTRKGYWIVNAAGQVFGFGDAHAMGNATGLAPGESVSSLSSTASGKGYWLFTSKGRALTFGDAHSYGDLRNVALNRPVIGSVATPTGHGYYMVATDGGIFSFGDAGFYGSTGHLHLNKPVNGLVPTPSNHGYWMVASDGGIFAFGDAAFRGSMGGRHLNSPIVGMVRYGNGYLMVGADGGIFDFSDKPFLGSLAGTPLPQPIVSVAS